MTNKSLPLTIEIVAHVTGSMNHCDHCQVFIDGAGIGGQVHQQDMQSYPEEFRRDWQRLSGWVQELASAFPDQLQIRITDAQSLRGLWLSLTRGARRYPAFLVGEQDVYTGWDHPHVEGLIHSSLEARSAENGP